MALEDMARKIKQLRQDQGLTLEQVAKVVGVGKSTVRKWETGMIANMKRDKIAALAKALHTTPAYLMGWEKKVEENPVGEANKLADWYLGLEFKEHEDVDFLTMVSEYKQLDASKQEQVRDYVHFLLGRN